MISDERRYGDRIQAHMRWLSCTARECGPAAQRDMDRWVCAHVEHGAVPPVPPALEALGVKKSLSRNELRKRLRTEGAGRGRTEQAASGKLQNFLKDAALAARCQRWEFRVAEEMRANAGWYVVWASLTFDPKAWDPEYELRENRAFDRFAMRMAESVRMALGLRQPQDGGPSVLTTAGMWAWWSMVCQGSITISTRFFGAGTCRRNGRWTQTSGGWYLTLHRSSGRKPSGPMTLRRRSSRFGFWATGGVVKVGCCPSKRAVQWC